ncbi:hypothetical protein NSP_15310 [Nodularia spumigena CCY9414]|nr:hypothetical protein NSP_15310 [Nodularia spumigena CCY9414]
MRVLFRCSRSGPWGEEERGQGAGGRGEEERLLSNRKF